MVYLVVTPFFPEPGDFHGPYVLDQVKALMRTGRYRVVVMKPVPFWQQPVDYEIDGVQVYRFRHWTLPSNALPNRLCDRLSARSMFRKLREIGIKADDIAVCHGHVTSFGAYALAVKRRNAACVAVVQHHGFDVMSITDGRFARQRWHERQCVRYGRRICNAVDLNIGVSQKTLDYVKQYPAMKLKRQYVLYNGVDTTKFYPPAEAQPRERFTIGCIANFWPLKDQMTLIRAVERLVRNGERNLLVRFIGTGITREGCERYVREHGLASCVRFENEVMHDQLLAFYHSLDLFVLPSYWEAFGCVYTEAYACGVPFMAVEGQGIAEIVPEDERRHWLIQKGDDARLAQLIHNYMQHPRSQHLSLPYDINTLVGEYAENLERLT